MFWRFAVYLEVLLGWVVNTEIIMGFRLTWKVFRSELEGLLEQLDMRTGCLHCFSYCIYGTRSFYSCDCADSVVAIIPKGNYFSVWIGNQTFHYFPV